MKINFYFKGSALIGCCVALEDWNDCISGVGGCHLVLVGSRAHQLDDHGPSSLARCCGRNGLAALEHCHRIGVVDGEDRAYEQRTSGGPSQRRKRSLIRARELFFLLNLSVSVLVCVEAKIIEEGEHEFSGKSGEKRQRRSWVNISASVEIYKIIISD